MRKQVLALAHDVDFVPERRGDLTEAAGKCVGTDDEVFHLVGNSLWQSYNRSFPHSLLGVTTTRVGGMIC